LDLGTGMGLPDAVRGVDVVVHAASSPVRAPQRVDVAGTDSLCRAAAEAGVRHIVFPGIVGADRVPMAYYRAKVDAEHVIERSGLPFTIQRTTQFHRFVRELLGMGPCGLSLVPSGWQVQPIDEEVVAELLVQAVRDGPRGRAPDAGGPEILSAADCAPHRAHADRRARSRRRIHRHPQRGALLSHGVPTGSAAQRGDLRMPGNCTPARGSMPWYCARAMPSCTVKDMSGR
jgi:uncharacterized protein YbjT (DUF2867 family)